MPELNNYLMAHKAVFESKAAIIRFSSISLLTGIIASLLAYFALEMILKINTPFNIYLLMIFLIIIKYTSVMPSVFMMHAKLQTQRIASTFFAGCVYLVTAFALVMYDRLTLLTLIITVLLYHSLLLMRNVYSIVKYIIRSATD